MKRFFVSSLILATALAFGCAKERTCTETTTLTNGTTSTTVTKYDKLTPKQRREIENYGTYTSDNGTKHKVECKK